MHASNAASTAARIGIGGRCRRSRTLERETLLDSIQLADLMMLHTVDSHGFAREAAAFEKPPAA